MRIQEYLIENLTTFDQNTFVDITSSINPQARMESLELAVINNTQKFRREYPNYATILNPIDRICGVRDSVPNEFLEIMKYELDSRLQSTENKDNDRLSLDAEISGAKSASKALESDQSGRAIYCTKETQRC